MHFLYWDSRFRPFSYELHTSLCRFTCKKTLTKWVLPSACSCQALSIFLTFPRRPPTGSWLWETAPYREAPRVTCPIVSSNCHYVISAKQNNCATFWREVRLTGNFSYMWWRQQDISMKKWPQTILIGRRCLSHSLPPILLAHTTVSHQGCSESPQSRQCWLAPKVTKAEFIQSRPALYG